MTPCDEPIDAVVTWVDGDAAAHKSLREFHLRENEIRSMKYIPSGQGDRRYKNNNEIEFCLHSIRKYLPWIRNIYLVTDKQIPEFLSEEIKKKLNVEIVDHSIIFRGFEWALPTFNSVTIESMLYRIPGISGKYIYFNDDVIPIQPVNRSDFFVDDRVVLRGEWRPLRKHGRTRLFISGVLNKAYKALSLRDRPMNLLQQYRAADLAGLTRFYLEAPHTPHPVKTTSISSFFESDEHQKVLAENIKHKFRHMDQFVMHPFANYLEIKKGNFIHQEMIDYLTITFTKDRKTISNQDLAHLESGNIKFFCVQSLECATSESRQLVENFLRSRIFE